MSSSLNPRTPVLAGVKTVIQREEDSAQAKDTLRLMVEAALGAEADAGAQKMSAQKSLLEGADEIISMSSITKMENPAYLLAQAVGAKNTKTVLAEVGVLQQAVFDRACRNIQEDGADAVLVVGSETQYRELRAKIAGTELPPPLVPPSDGNASGVPPPDVLMTPETDIVHPLEIEMGLSTAPSHYAFLENAFGVAKGLTPTEQRQKTAELWEGFNRVAQKNPTAHFPQAKSAKEITAPSEKNRIIAAPYNKWNCSQINVDQASALLFVSAELAEKVQIPKDRWVFPWASAVSNHMVPVVQRKEMHRCAGFQIVGEKVFGAVVPGYSAGSVSHIDLYSCFPVAVWIQAAEMGIDIDRQLTVTGGMTFGGGPLNSYVLGSLAKMAEVLREADSTAKTKSTENLGLVTSISGMISKQGAGVWSSRPPPESLPQYFDLTAEVKAATEICEVQPDYAGPATAVSSTLLYNRDGQSEKSVCIADTNDGRRTMAFSTEADLLEMLAGDDYLGRLSGTPIQINKDREFSLN